MAPRIKERAPRSQESRKRMRGSCKEARRAGKGKGLQRSHESRNRLRERETSTNDLNKKETAQLLPFTTAHAIHNDVKSLTRYNG